MSYSFFELAWIVLTCAILGCQPNPEANKAAPPSGSDNASISGEKPITDADPSKDSSTSSGATKGSDGKKNEDTAIANSSEEAKQLITDCITNYGAIKSYQDEAVLHLSVPLEKDPILEIRPLKIAYERPNKLAMNVRSLRSMWSSQTFESVVGDGQFAPFDNQRIVRPLPERINLSWLLEDHLSSVVPIPNIGLPLSIELMLAPNPLEYFFSSGKFSMLPKDVFDNVLCERIEVIYNEGRFVFWVDRERKLFLREELPIEIILATFPSLPPEFDRKQIRFSVDLVAARSNQPIDWSTWSLPRQANDMLVRRFADPPFRGLPRTLGTELSPVLLKDVDNKDIFDSAARKSPITLLAWIDNSNASRSFVDDVRAFERVLSNRGLQSSCQILLVSNLPADKMKVAMQTWNCDFPLALDTNRELQKQCGVSNTFATVVIGRDNRLHMISEVLQWNVLPDIIQQLKEGVNLAAREMKVAVDNEARYASRLHRNILDKDQIEKMDPIHQTIDYFPFFFHDMKKDWGVDLEQPLAAAGGELYVPHGASDAIVADELFAKKDNAYRMMTGLDETGGIYTFDQSGAKALISSIPIELATNAKRIHVRPEPWTHGWVAVIPEGLPRFWFFVAPVKTSGAWTPTEAAQIKLDDGESIESSTWAMKDGTPQLCMTTNKSKLRIFDPTTQKLSNLKLESDVVSMVGVIPQLDAKAHCIGWNSIWSDSAIDALPGMSVESEMRQLPFRPEFGNWVWGMGRQGPQLVGLQKLESGETGSIQMDINYKPRFSTALSVRAEQCRLLSAASSEKNQFYWLASAPNRVLHLQTQDGGLADQMSFGERVFGATIVPDGSKFKLIVALEKEVSCWTVEPKPLK